MWFVMEGWVTCPHCGGHQDAAAVFAEASDDRYLIETGLMGICDACDGEVRLELVAVQPDTRTRVDQRYDADDVAARGDVNRVSLP